MSINTIVFSNCHICLSNRSQPRIPLSIDQVAHSPSRNNELVLLVWCLLFFRKRIACRRALCSCRTGASQESHCRSIRWLIFQVEITSLSFWFGACSFSESALHVVTHFAVAGTLKKAGDSFVSLSKLLDPPSDSSNQSVGDALFQAHASWNVDWTEVTMALADAVTSFSRMSDQFSESNSAASDFHQKISPELEDASNISGCMSVGPPSSARNLEAI
jgi:hypothetical protein